MKYCSIEAFARCPLNERCGDFRDASYMEGSECDTFNQAILNRPRTNADRIRNMSDAEMVDLMMIMPAIPCDEKMRVMMNENGCSDCERCIMDWLQQPAEV